jgi:nitroreductase
VSGESRVLARAALTALKAPSILNSQPWCWRVDGRVLELRADRSRQATGMDPDGRLLTLSCGVALHHVRTALAVDGVRIRVEYRPDPAEPDLLAVITHLGPAGPADPTTLRAYRAIATRHSDRRPFDDLPVPDATLDRLCAAADRPGAHVRFAPAGDGHARNAVIVTDGDSPRDWLVSGEALSAFLLAATAEGLATSVMSDQVEAPAARALLRRTLRSAGHPAIVVRVGRPGTGPSPAPTSRRPGHEMVQVVV